MIIPHPGERVLGALLLLLLVGFALVPLCTWQPSYFSSGVSYRLTIQTDAPLRNATFLIPLPVRKGIPAVGFLNLTPSMFERPGFNASFVSREGNEYLSLTAVSIDVQPSWEGEYHADYTDRSERMVYDNLGTRVEYDRAEDYPNWLDTKHPLVNETVFLPKLNMSLTTKPPSPPPIPTRADYLKPVVHRYQTKMYIAFETENTSFVEVYAYLDGYNTWSEEFDAWRGNSYSDSIHGSFFRAPSVPSPDGWYLVDGEMESGGGKYLDGTY